MNLMTTNLGLAMAVYFFTGRIFLAIFILFEHNIIRFLNKLLTGQLRRNMI